MIDDAVPADNESYDTYQDDEVTEVIARCPEIADLPDRFDVAQLLLMDLDLLDVQGWEDLL
jgi:hypothetical protein